MRLYSQSKLFFILFPVLSGSVLLEYRILGMSLVTFSTFLLVIASVCLYLLRSRLRIGYIDLYLMGIGTLLLVFGPAQIHSFFWIMLLFGGYTIGKNFSKTMRPVEKAKFIKLIKPMVLLTGVICIAQLLLQDRFLPPSLEETLNKDIFVAPWGYRLSAFSSNPNGLGYFLVFTLWTTYVYRSTLFKNKYSYTGFICLQVLMLFLTLSRGAFLVLLITVFLYGRGQAFIRALVFMLSAAVFLTAYSFTEDAFWIRVMNEPRIAGLLNVLDYLAEKPITLIWGMGFSDAVLREVGFSDNFLLQILIAGGIPGLALLLLSLPSISKISPSLDQRYLSGLKAILLLSMFFTASPQILYFFFPAICFFFVVFYSPDSYGVV